jgi:hypothetical protein
MTFFAPIVLFIYKRPLHLKETLNSLKKCTGFENHQIFVFADGPKNDLEFKIVNQTRIVAKSILGEKAHYTFSNTNKGLANSVIDGVTDIIQKFEKVIVIEDDLLFHPHFLNFMNNALQFYESNKNVFSVSGYMYNTKILENSKHAQLFPIISTWGWGTWLRAWNKLDHQCNEANNLLKNKSIKKKFDCQNNYPFTYMLKRQMSGSVDSWGIRWYWTIFKNNGLTCFPPSSLVKNNGFDSLATHGRGFLTNFKKNKLNKMYDKDDKVLFENKIVYNPEIFDKVCESLYNLNGGLIGKVRDFAKQIVIK